MNFTPSTDTYLTAILQPNRTPRKGGRFANVQILPRKRLFTHGTNTLNGEPQRI